ncbi:MAG: hypothetical protein RL221_718, partial [Pseudomonadota bacterium]
AKAAIERVRSEMNKASLDLRVISFLIDIDRRHYTTQLQ